MRLYEFEGKALFKQYGIPIPEGRPVKTLGEVVEAAKALGKPVVLKAQILSGGRGKAGGIKFADSPDEAGKSPNSFLN